MTDRPRDPTPTSSIAIQVPIEDAAASRLVSFGKEKYRTASTTGITVTITAAAKFGEVPRVHWQ